jgi:hypothetical protein
MSRFSEDLKDTLLFGGGGLLLASIVFSDTGPPAQAQYQPSAPAPSPNPTTPTPRPTATKLYAMYCDRDPTYDKAPGVLYLRELNYLNKSDVVMQRWPVFTGRIAAPYSKNTPPENRMQVYARPDPNHPVTVYGQAQKYFFKVTGPMVWRNVLELPSVQQELKHIPTTPYYQWVAPLVLGYNNGEVFEPYWNDPGADAHLVIEDQMALDTANAMNLKYPIVPQAITIRTTQDEAKSIAATINLALTHNQEAGKLLGIQMSA